LFAGLVGATAAHGITSPPHSEDAAPSPRSHPQRRSLQPGDGSGDVGGGDAAAAAVATAAVATAATIHAPPPQHTFRSDMLPSPLMPLLATAAAVVTSLVAIVPFGGFGGFGG